MESVVHAREHRDQVGHARFCSRRAAHDDGDPADELAAADESIAKVLDVLLDEIALGVIQTVYRILRDRLPACGSRHRDPRREIADDL